MRILKKSFVMTAFCLVTTLAYANTTFAASVSWQGYSNEVFAKSGKSKKPVFLFIKASWCQWCEKMNGTYSNPAVASKLNGHYIPVRIDIDKNSDIAKSYGVNTVPTMLILNSKNQVVNSLSGYYSASSLLRKI